MGSILSFIIFLAPNKDLAFWLFTAFSVQFALMMYILIFSSAIVLRYRRYELHPTFKVPAMNCCCAGLVILSCSIMLVVGFLPPEEALNANEVMLYILSIANNICLH